jgi:hypothetical protein
MDNRCAAARSTIWVWLLNSDRTGKPKLRPATHVSHFAQSGLKLIRVARLDELQLQSERGAWR